MSGTGSVAVVVLLLLLVVALPPIVSWNRFVSQRAAIDAAWSSIDLELQRRHDLVPNLVASVRGYIAHEQAVLAEVVAARTRAHELERAGAPASRQARAEDLLSSSLGRLIAVAEDHPELRADRVFHQLQAELTETEDRIAASRRLYNIDVQQYNRRVDAVPSNVVASLAGFERREYFDARGDAVERAVAVAW